MATRARAASRFLEDQVGGTRSNVDLQQDNASLSWSTLESKLSEPQPTPPQWLRASLSAVAWEIEQGRKAVLAVMDNITILSNKAADEGVGKLEREINGEMIQAWAGRLSIPVLKVAERALSDSSTAPAWQQSSGPRRSTGGGNRSPRNTANNRHRGPGSGGMVEKPPAPILAPGGIRLLARGETLGS